MCFIWIELFGHTSPFSLALILIGYSAINLAGAWLVGENSWFRYCEFLAVFLRIISKMAPFDFAQGRLRLRQPFIGLLREQAESTSHLAFVLFMIASTAFDGIRDTVPWVGLYWKYFSPALLPYLGNDSVKAPPALQPTQRASQTAGRAWTIAGAGPTGRMAWAVRRMRAAWFSRVNPYIPSGGGSLTRSKLSAPSGTPAYRRANPTQRKTNASWASTSRHRVDFARALRIMQYPGARRRVCERWVSRVRRDWR